ncbi:MAG TPA: hypothetical protein VIW73_01675 [Candidatus Cybelea sp.]
MTFRFDVHADGTALCTVTNVMDDELYRLALNQNANGDPFGLAQLEREGWNISRMYDENGDHVVTISKSLSRNDLSVGGGAAPLRSAVLPLSSINLSRTGGFFVERDSVAATIAPLLPWAEATLKRPYASVAWAVLASAVALHLELRTPGKVFATNGETAPDRFVRWDLSLRAPTTIRYSVRVLRVDRIAVIMIALAILVFVGYWALRLRSLRSLRPG